MHVVLKPIFIADALFWSRRIDLSSKTNTIENLPTRGVKKLSRPLTLGDSYVYVASTDTDLGRRGRAGTAVSFAQAGHVR